jgi:UDP-glucose 4-epimerase
MDMHSDLVILTGASGFAGRYFAPRAATEFGDMLCYAGPDNSDFERRGKELLTQSRVPFVEADFVTGRGLMKVKTQPRFVFHLAATTATWSRDHRCNDLGTRNFIRSLQGLGPRSHVLFTSSIAVMDQRTDYTRPLTETSNVEEPLTTYGQSKLRAENWLREQAAAIGFSLTILRLVTLYGPNARARTLFPTLKHHVLHRSILARLSWPGLTGLLHVEDLNKILLALAHKPPPPGTCQIYLAEGEARALATMSQLIHERLGMAYKPIALPPWFWKSFFQACGAATSAQSLLPSRAFGTFWRARLLAQNVFYANPEKLHATLPEWTPAMLEETIDETLGARPSRAQQRPTTTGAQLHDPRAKFTLLSS